MFLYENEASVINYCYVLKQNECSFVSLRDVERAMIVFEYFYERMDLFAPLMNNKAIEELKDKHVVESDEELVR